MFTLLVVLLSLGLIVGIHEACHMIVSKLFGVKVLKFSFGFGPLLFSKQIGDTSYELRLLPLGGFILPEGDNPEDNTPRGFFSLPWYKRALIALAGPTANLILSLLILYGILVFYKGWPLVLGFIQAVKLMGLFISTTLKWMFGIKSALAPDPHMSDVAGPIMVTKILASSVKEGVSSFGLVLSVISLSLGLFNLFPVPGLDGGHIFLYLLEGLRGKKFSNKVYTIWSYIGLLLLGLLMLFACTMDIMRLR